MVRQMRVELFGGDVGRMMMRIAEDEEIEARTRAAWIPKLSKPDRRRSTILEIGYA
jgi:hypothetical protein